ncbi:uncharacterized protein BCR38DRAFT_447817 [Pseudomassariella vexata]|uniref:Formyl transferase C-terminal domain-containing protein n=1 Tax=Pseudomassariella vexata TaxID=1141098 RepID=A0A1Y2DFK5_9PEZI|nr:uncharacterized protein BCR38DRAFT_447817 [Pseudomassariella vexata]ORY58038.1 hypothetical protein BCR38DRAFT_447817 [Pseudomassariella vexata]
MKILLLCTAHNSLSQRLSLTLSETHDVTVEYAISTESTIQAVRLARPHLIICPFLTTLVPKEVYSQYLTLIVHPGPPDDAGPSALDWVLMGDDGTVSNADEIVRDEKWSEDGRSHWGVTVLQAIEEFDAGPVWAFEQFPIDIDDPAVTKSSVYRGTVTRAAVTAVQAAIERIQFAALASVATPTSNGSLPLWDLIGPYLKADSYYRSASVTTQEPFLGGVTRCRPLLKANQRGFDVRRHTARNISRRIRASDSQPGCLSSIFGLNLYLYGGIVEAGEGMATVQAVPGTIIACRDEAVCVATCDGKGIWITHLRRIKRKVDAMLWPKVPAMDLLVELGILDAGKLPRLLAPPPRLFAKASHPTFQDISIEYETLPTQQRISYLSFTFYNGAMSTTQCRRLSSALSSILSTHTESAPLAAVVLGGPSYFSNGVHLNVIEAAADPATESWMNINAINDVVQTLLLDFAVKGITTIAAVRGNAAAGGVALAAACDVVVAGENVVLNPAYRALGLYGSEFHSISYSGRCGDEVARRLLRGMLPISTTEAVKIGLIDAVVSGFGGDLDMAIRAHVRELITSGKRSGEWKDGVDISAAGLSLARASELGEMSKDFWSARSLRYHSRRRDFVRKVKATKTPLRFAAHRRKGEELDEEEEDSFDNIEDFEDRIVNEIKERALRRSLKALGVTETASMTPSRVEVSDKHLGPVFSCYYST